MTIRYRQRSRASVSAAPAEEVGYGKPPMHTRFQRGKSGNPKGRPKGSGNTVKHLRDSLSKTMPVTVDGKRTRMRRDQAFFEGLLRDALKGDNAARRMLLSAMAKIPDDESTLEPGAAAAFEAVAGPADDEILERYRQEVIEDHRRARQRPSVPDEDEQD
jgi:hypothetical protein